MDGSLVVCVLGVQRRRRRRVLRKRAIGVGDRLELRRMELVIVVSYLIFYDISFIIHYVKVH